MDQPYPCSSVSHVEMAPRWLLGVCISNWLCTIPLTPPPLPLPTSILSLCVCVCVCVHTSCVYVCACACAHVYSGKPFARVHDDSLSLSASNSLTCTSVCSAHLLHYVTIYTVLQSHYCILFKRIALKDNPAMYDFF